MTKKKSWYAVKKGWKTGLFENWEDCKHQVMGYAGAEYKGFYSKEEAEMYLGIHSIDNIETDESNCPGRLIAYVDGSYMPNQPDRFSFGVVFIYEGKMETYAEKIVSPEEATMRNVAGEIHGAAYAMETCLKRGISEMDLYYDYAGIEKWCTGEWKANKKGTKALQNYYASVKNELTVHFHKVASHTGVIYNEMADRLAKSALEVK